MNPYEYILNECVYCCACDDYVVFLDAKNHRYRAVSAADTAGLGSIVKGWPSSQATTSESSADRERISKRANELVTQGILRKSTHQKPAPDTRALETPTCDLSMIQADPGAATLLQPSLVLIISFIQCRLKQRYSSFEEQVAWVQRRNRSLETKSRIYEPEKIIRLVEIYNYLKPWFFASRNACMFESLLLNTFLAKYGIATNWVFGVRMKPWLAHCWLQKDHMVVGDTIQHVNYFTPIMRA